MYDHFEFSKNKIGAGKQNTFKNIEKYSWNGMRDNEILVFVSRKTLFKIIFVKSNVFWKLILFFSSFKIENRFHNNLLNLFLTWKFINKILYGVCSTNVCHNQKTNIGTLENTSKSLQIIQNKYTFPICYGISCYRLKEKYWEIMTKFVIHMNPLIS